MRRGVLICGGLIPGVTQVLRKRWAYLRGEGAIHGGLIGGEIRYLAEYFFYLTAEQYVRVTKQ